MEATPRQIDTADLVARIEAHLQRTGVTATEFGRSVTGSGSLLTNMKRGMDPRLSTVNRILAALEGKAP